MPSGILDNVFLQAAREAFKQQSDNLQFPGDSTRGIPRGVFSPHPITTPKYARQGSDSESRTSDFTDTMARLFVQVGPTEYQRFLESVGAGDPASAELARVLAGTNLGVGAQAGGAGYIDFLLQGAQHSLQEKRDVVELLGDNYVAYYFGSAAPMFSYSGILVNSKEDDQAHNMYRIYRDMIRGTQLARRRKVVALRYDNMIVRGTTDGFSWQLGGENEMMCPFSFQLLVKTVLLLPNPDWGIVPVQEPFAVSTQNGGSLLPTLATVTVHTRDPALRVTATPVSKTAGGTREKTEAAATTPAMVTSGDTPPATMPPSEEATTSLLRREEHVDAPWVD